MLPLVAPLRRTWQLALGSAWPGLANGSAGVWTISFQLGLGPLAALRDRRAALCSCHTCLIRNHIVCMQKSPRHAQNEPVLLPTCHPTCIGIKSMYGYVPGTFLRWELRTYSTSQHSCGNGCDVAVVGYTADALEII